MNEKANTTPADEGSDENRTDQPISVSNINALINETSVTDTIDHVGAVLDVLGHISVHDGVGKRFDFGLYLIHQWLSDTLRFVRERPD